MGDRHTWCVTVITHRRTASKRIAAWLTGKHVLCAVSCTTALWKMHLLYSERLVPWFLTPGSALCCVMLHENDPKVLKIPNARMIGSDVEGSTAQAFYACCCIKYRHTGILPLHQAPVSCLHLTRVLRVLRRRRTPKHKPAVDLGPHGRRGFAAAATEREGGCPVACHVPVNLGSAKNASCWGTRQQIEQGNSSKPKGAPSRSWL